MMYSNSTIDRFLATGIACGGKRSVDVTSGDLDGALSFSLKKKKVIFFNCNQLKP